MQTESPRVEAARKGAVHFTHPKACRVCGDSERYVLSNQCVTCTKERSARYAQRIRDLVHQARSGEER